jgi:HAMP domain-containing protein
MRKLVLGSVLALVLAAAGCGGGSKTLSKADYESQLNTICADYNAKAKQIGQPNTIQELGTKGGQLIGEFDKAIAKAEKLKTPKEIKDTRDQFFSKSKELRDTLSQLVDAAKKNDAQKISELGATATSLNSQVDSLAKQLNAPACASNA